MPPRRTNTYRIMAGRHNRWWRAWKYMPAGSWPVKNRKPETGASGYKGRASQMGGRVCSAELPKTVDHGASYSTRKYSLGTLRME